MYLVYTSSRILAKRKHILKALEICQMLEGKHTYLPAFTFEINDRIINRIRSVFMLHLQEKALLEKVLKR